MRADLDAVRDAAAHLGLERPTVSVGSREVGGYRVYLATLYDQAGGLVGAWFERSDRAALRGLANLIRKKINKQA